MAFKKKNQGIMLLEMLIYIVVLTVLMVVIIEVLFSITKADRIIKAERNIESSTILTFERIGREARAAETISGSSILGVHPGKLVLTGETASGTARTVEFYLSSGKVRMREDGVDTGTLTATGTTVTKLIFTRFATSSIEGVRTELELESGTSTNYRKEHFYTSVLLRNDI